jgi:hypothetical protein
VDSKPKKINLFDVLSLAVEERIPDTTATLFLEES